MEANPTGESIYSKDNIRIVDSKSEGGKFKRVFRVEIDDGNENRRAMLKLARIFRKDSNVRLTEVEKMQTNVEAQDLWKLKLLIPNHVPGYLGKYQSANNDGILVEEVQGSIISNRNGEIIQRPSKEQWNRFKDAIVSLTSQGIFIELDTLLLHNLMLGKLPGSDQEEIIMIEPKIIDGINDDGKIMAERYVIGALKSDSNTLFPS